MATRGPSPYVKLGAALVTIGMGLFGLERLGLSRIEGSAHDVHLDPTLLSVLILAPLALVALGTVIFVVGRMRRM